MTSALTIWIDSSLSGKSASAARIPSTQCCTMPASPAKATVIAVKEAVSVRMPPR